MHLLRYLKSPPRPRAFIVVTETEERAAFLRLLETLSVPSALTEPGQVLSAALEKLTSASFSSFACDLPFYLEGNMHFSLESNNFSALCLGVDSSGSRSPDTRWGLLMCRYRSCFISRKFSRCVCFIVLFFCYGVPIVHVFNLSCLLYLLPLLPSFNFHFLTCF